MILASLGNRARLVRRTRHRRHWCVRISSCSRSSFVRRVVPRIRPAIDASDVRTAAGGNRPPLRDAHQRPCADRGGRALRCALFTILPEFGLDIRAVLAGVGITSIAIGLGAQSLVRDTLTGIFILIENQYAPATPSPSRVSPARSRTSRLRRTVLRDVDGVLYSVPNARLPPAANLHARLRERRASRFRSHRQRTSTGSGGCADRVGQELAADPEYAGRSVAARYLRVDSIDMMGGVAVQVNGTVVPGKQWEVAGALRARLLEAFQARASKSRG